MVQVLGFSIYGYAFGLGRLVLLMDLDEINDVAIYTNLVSKLISKNFLSTASATTTRRTSTTGAR
jgi:hypothetical protein